MPAFTPCNSERVLDKPRAMVFVMSDTISRFEEVPLRNTLSGTGLPADGTVVAGSESSSSGIHQRVSPSCQQIQAISPDAGCWRVFSPSFTIPSCFNVLPVNQILVY